jgi:site-specific recombinase XerD
MLTEWHIRDFLGYLVNEKCRWGIEGNGAETCQDKASHTTVHHYFVVLANFFRWAVREGLLAESPAEKIRVARPRDKVIKPYAVEEIERILAVCEHDYEHKARFLGSRNKAIVLVLVDSGVRLSELIGMAVQDVNTSNGNIRVMGKGSKERVVRIGKVTQKALWRYVVHRSENSCQELWLTEEKRPLSCGAVQCLVKRLKQRAGVNGSGSVRRFRHTFALSQSALCGGVP